jgi:hypothetical protein
LRGDRLDFLNERRRKQQRVTTCGQGLEDSADRWNEAHVEHAIRLIDGEDLDAGKIHGALLHVIEEASRASRQQRQDFSATPGPAASLKRPRKRSC